MKKHFYAVRKGRKNNVVVTTWAECSALVTGYPGAVFKGFGIHEEQEAIKYAKSTAKPSYLKRGKEKAKANQQKPIGECIMRKNYKDPITGIYYKNRCVIRRGPTITGPLYVESDDTSCPF